MQGFYTILLLVASNIFMTCAWYGHLKMKQQFSWFEHLPLIGVVFLNIVFRSRQTGWVSVIMAGLLT